MRVRIPAACLCPRPWHAGVDDQRLVELLRAFFYFDSSFVFLDLGS